MYGSYVKFVGVEVTEEALLGGVGFIEVLLPNSYRASLIWRLGRLHAHLKFASDSRIGRLGEKGEVGERGGRLVLHSGCEWEKVGLRVSGICFPSVFLFAVCTKLSSHVCI